MQDDGERRTPPVHAPVEGIERVDGRLAFDGHVLDALAKRLGRTPFYAYSSAALARRIARARAALPAGTRLHYAVKANPFVPLVRWMAHRVDGADVASVGEMRLALAAGFAPADIGFAGPAKRAEEIDAAVRAGVVVTAESERQLRAVASAASATGRPAMAALRVNPANELRASGMRMGGGPSAFGIDEEQVPALLELADALGVRIVGLHFFPGSQSLRADAIASALRANAQAAVRLMRGRRGWRWLNLGGGFGVPYAAGEVELDTAPIRAALEEVVAMLGEATTGPAARQAAWSGNASPQERGAGRKDEGTGPRAPSTGPEEQRAGPKGRSIEPKDGWSAPVLRLELGRYLVADAGIYVCRVLDRKESRGRRFVLADGGLHHNQAATGNFGQVIKRPYPLLNASRPDAGAETVDLVGPLCTPMDCFGRDVRIARPAVGDLIAVLRSGAYGRSASPTAFLGHEDCLEVLLDDDTDTVTTGDVAAQAPARTNNG